MAVYFRGKKKSPRSFKKKKDVKYFPSFIGIEYGPKIGKKQKTKKKRKGKS